MARAEAAGRGGESAVGNSPRNAQSSPSAYPQKGPIGRDRCPTTGQAWQEKSQMRYEIVMGVSRNRANHPLQAPCKFLPIRYNQDSAVTEF